MHAFSCKALHLQSHEQLNKCIKGDGIVGLTADPSALRRWMLAGPEITCIVAEFEESVKDNSTISY